MFYLYEQNTNEQSEIYSVDHLLGRFIVVEAENLDEAVTKVKQIFKCKMIEDYSLYFDGKFETLKDIQEELNYELSVFDNSESEYFFGFAHLKNGVAIDLWHELLRLQHRSQ